MNPRPQWLGRLGYRWAWRLQRARRDAIVAGRAPEAFWLVEHDPVVTTGRRSVEILPDHVEVIRTERGGLATWHGPGQLVGYLLIDVAGRGLGVKRTIAAVEQGITHWLDAQGVDAARRTGFPGVWVGRDKICAVGMHFRKGISMHGFALNLDPDLDAFSGFVPCGIKDGGVTSLARVAGGSPPVWQVAESVGADVVDALGKGG